MKKINYPYLNEVTSKLVESKKKDFVEKYLKLFPSNLKRQINIAAKKLDTNLSADSIFCCSFPQMKELAEKQDLNDEDWKELNNIFYKNKVHKYDSYKSKIANFLIKEELEIRTCYYCNLDFINSFTTEEYYYVSFEEILNVAPRAILISIEGISSTTTNKILDERKSKRLNKKDILKIFPKIGNGIISKLSENINVKIVLHKKHFTLDHVFPKNAFPFLSLSIFNFVPSCYPCNSLFKKEKEFNIKNQYLAKVIPVSEEFILDKMLKFKLNFNYKQKEFNNKIFDVNSLDDITVNLTNLSSLTDVDRFIDMFKLKYRYEFHKNISFEIINKMKKYSNSQMQEIANILGEKDINKIKRDIFGTEIFESTNAPFEKYKQDIAQQLGII